jgi:hypothetical protein
MDLQLDYGDFSTQKVEESYEGITYYDLVIENEEQAITKLIRRTLETPLGYIKKAVINQVGIESLDADYGNPLYGKLGDLLTPSFIAQAESGILNALLKLKDIPSLVINNVSVINVGLNSLTIEVTFTYNSNQTSTTFNLPT